MDRSFLTPPAVRYTNTCACCGQSASVCPPGGRKQPLSVKIEPSGHRREGRASGSNLALSNLLRRPGRQLSRRVATVATSILGEPMDAAILIGGKPVAAPFNPVINPARRDEVVGRCGRSARVSTPPGLWMRPTRPFGTGPPSPPWSGPGCCEPPPRTWRHPTRVSRVADPGAWQASVGSRSRRGRSAADTPLLRRSRLTLRHAAGE